MKQKNNIKGITLIALVITIVVLLILAGVSVAMLTGDNGILSQVVRAKEKTDEVKKKEENNLNDYEAYIKEATGKKVYRVGESPKIMNNPPEYSWIAGDNPDIENPIFNVAYDKTNNKINDIFSYNGNVAQASTVFPMNSMVVSKCALVGTNDLYKDNLLNCEFQTNSAVIEIILYGITPGIIIQVDEGNGYKYVEYSYIQSENTGTVHILKLNFINSINRKIKIETGARFGGVYITNDATTSKVDNNVNPKAIFIGTSITERKTALGYYNTISYKLGLTGYNWGVGATGYVTESPFISNSVRYNYYNRIVANKEFISDADIVVIEGGINDISQNTSNVINEQTKCINYIKTNCPNAKIIIIGVFWPRGNGQDTTSCNLNNLLRENSLSNKVSFIDLLTGDTISEDGKILTTGTRPYITENGHVGAETNDGGNADIYIEEDGTHPTQEGCNYLGNRLAEEFAKILNN